MQTVMQPGEVESPRGDIPFLFLPLRDDLFASRARRFRQLAENHSLGGFLRLMGQLAESQQQVIDAFPAQPAPSPSYLEECARGGFPPLGVFGWQRDPTWRDGLRRLLESMVGKQLPKPAGVACARLERCGEDELERFATGLLSQDFAGVPPEAVPFVAGALQIYWTAMARTLTGRQLPRLEPANLCPVCGSPPVAAVVKSGGGQDGLRYLCCSLCSSQWHMVRAICSNCDASKGITYFGIDGQPGPVSAESCSQCHSYLKIIKLEESPGADPQADDLATLAIDLLLEREGCRRGGANLQFHPGSL